MAAVAAWGLATAGSAVAEPGDVRPEAATPGEAAGEQSAFWAGADGTGAAWSLYAGSDTVFYGTLDDPGWRMRAVGGYGQYHYSRAVMKRAAGGGTRRGRRRYTGHKLFSDILIGYQFQWNDTTLKTFVGGNSEHHTIAPYDPEARVDSEAYGVKVAGDIWHRFSDTHWLAGHASFATTFTTYKFEARNGWRVMPDIDLGLEARLEGNADYDGGRVGAFATLHFGSGALTAHAGVGADRDLDVSPYVSVGLFVRY